MNESPEVDAWFAETCNPLADVMRRVRAIILAADARITECIKWKTPTFTYRGNLASFNPNAKQHVSLMLHTGAAIPGEHPRLEGGGDTARYMKFADMAQAEASKGALEAIVAAWVRSRTAVV